MELPIVEATRFKSILGLGDIEHIPQVKGHQNQK